MNIFWWVEDNWLLGRDKFAEYKVRVKPYPEAWRREVTDLFWHVWTPHLCVFSQEEAEGFHAPRRKERLLDRFQGHFPFPYADYHPRFHPSANNPYALEWLLRGLSRNQRLRVRDNQVEAWSWILFFHKFPKVSELYDHNPLLAELLFVKFGLEIVQGIRHPNQKEFNRALHGRQRGLLSFLDLPAEERVVKVLKKTDLFVFCYGDEDYCENLNTVLDQRVLYHVPRIDWQVWTALMRLKDPLLPTTASFVMEIATSSPETRISWEESFCFVRDVIKVSGIRLPAVRSMKHLTQLVEKIKKWVKAEDFPMLKKMEIPNPPWPGNEEIQPLNSPLEYIKESLTMHNCILSLLPDAVKGHVAHYRVLAPERATLEIRYKPGGGCVISQFKGKYNRDLKISTISGFKDRLHSIV